MKQKIMVDTCLCSSYFSVTRAKIDGRKIKSKEQSNHDFLLEIMKNERTEIVLSDLILWEIVRGLSPKEDSWEQKIVKHLKMFECYEIAGTANIETARIMVKKLQINGHNLKGNIDGLIAHACLKENLTLVSDDSGFRHVVGLKFIEVPKN